MKEVIDKSMREHRKALDIVQARLSDEIERAAVMLAETLRRGDKILICGNGGSAADAQHIAAELTGRFAMEREALPAIALTTDTSALTAIANDYGFDRVFERQIEALAKRGDVLIGISTSGRSQNIIRALERARHKGCATLGLSGRDGGVMDELCDLNLTVPLESTARIQEMHIFIGHIICELVEKELFS